MNHHDAEITDVVVVLDNQGQKSMDDSLGRLKTAGLEVADVNVDEGVVEGSIDAGRVHDLKNIPGVCYVRSVFTYTADFPAGDPRDQDGAEPAVEDED